MRLLCAPVEVGRLNERGALRVVLYGQAGAHDRASAGAARMPRATRACPTSRATSPC